MLTLFHWKEEAEVLNGNRHPVLPPPACERSKGLMDMTGLVCPRGGSRFSSPRRRLARVALSCFQNHPFKVSRAECEYCWAIPKELSRVFPQGLVKTGFSRGRRGESKFYALFSSLHQFLSGINRPGLKVWGMCPQRLGFFGTCLYKFVRSFTSR